MAKEYRKNTSPERVDIESISLLYVSPVLVDPVGLIQVD
jgi:hypothetical protein